MITLEETKNEVAKENGCKDWDDLHDYYVEINSPFNIVLDQVVKRYALEAIKADRERIADSAKIIKTANGGSYMDASVDKQSILDLPYDLK